jgi:cytoskeletal protein RodZ
MESLGNYLRDLRLARGRSVAEVARITRVGSDYLKALEEERWSELPAPVFTKGFIRAYCQALGEPPGEAVARYSMALQALPPAPFASGAPGARGRARGTVLVSLILLIALGLGLFLVNLGLQKRSAPEVTATITPAASGLLQPVPAPAPPAPTAVTRVEQAAEVRLIARTTEPTWVRVETDRGRIIEELIPAGATRQWSSDQRFVLTIGNAGGISLELNGRSLPPLGRSGVVVRRLVLPQDARGTDP